MSITPKAIQDLLDELERQSKAGCALGMFCSDSVWFFQRAETFAIRPPAQKTFDAEGEILEHALAKSLRIRSEAIKAYVPLYAAFATLPSRKNANPIIRTHFRPFA